METLKNALLVALTITVIAGCQSNAGKNKKDTAKKSAESNTAQLINKWSTERVLKTPESVCYDVSKEVLYVANIQGDPTKKDGNGFISKLSLKGEVTNLKWVTGLDAPKGMGVYEGKLYVTNIDEIVEIDITNGTINKRYKCEGAKFANDIAINEAGAVYASGMSTGTIYRLKNGKTKKWIESKKLNRPNGLFTQKDYLLIGMSGAVMQADYKTGTLKEYISNTGGIDGLEAAGKEYYIKSDWTGHVHLIHPKKDKQLLLNTADDNINAADIEFVPDKNMLYVPTFHDNRVMAYKLKW